MVDITSPSNERIRWLLRLRDRRHRDAEGLFLVEGERLYTRALVSGLVPEITFVTPEMDVDTAGPVLTVDRAALDRASYRQRSQGVIGVFPHLETGLIRLRRGGDALFMIAEGIEKPGNLGAMLRTSSAAGVDGLVAVGGDIDPHNPNVSRASTGALFDVPLAVAHWDELEPWLRSSGVSILCTTPAGGVAVWDADLTAAVALVVGAEDQGLSGRALTTADETISIPQADGLVDSLNVSVAAGILLFEARRQRG